MCRKVVRPNQAVGDVDRGGAGQRYVAVFGAERNVARQAIFDAPTEGVAVEGQARLLQGKPGGGDAPIVDAHLGEAAEAVEQDIGAEQDAGAPADRPAAVEPQGGGAEHAEAGVERIHRHRRIPVRPVVIDEAAEHEQRRNLEVEARGGGKTEIGPLEALDTESRSDDTAGRYHGPAVLGIDADAAAQVELRPRGRCGQRPGFHRHGGAVGGVGASPCRGGGRDCRERQKGGARRPAMLAHCPGSPIPSRERK